MASMTNSRTKRERLMQHATIKVRANARLPHTVSGTSRDFQEWLEAAKIRSSTIDRAALLRKAAGCSLLPTYADCIAPLLAFATASCRFSRPVVRQMEQRCSTQLLVARQQQRSA